MAYVCHKMSFNGRVVRTHCKTCKSKLGGRILEDVVYCELSYCNEINDWICFFKTWPRHTSRSPCKVVAMRPKNLLDLRLKSKKRWRNLNPNRNWWETFIYFREIEPHLDKMQEYVDKNNKYSVQWRLS